MRFAYVQFFSNDGIGYACFANDGDKVAAAFCSPKDFFDKRVARSIAEGRVRSDKFVTIPMENRRGYNYVMLTHFRDNDLLPSWARRTFDAGDYGLTLTQNNRYLSEEDDSCSANCGCNS